MFFKRDKKEKAAKVKKAPMVPLSVLTVCGSGTVTSTMIGEKIKTQLGEKGFLVKITEVNSGGVETAMSTGKFDFIAFTSPVPGNYDIPIFDAVGLLTGLSEEKFIEDVLKSLTDLGKYQG